MKKPVKIILIILLIVGLVVGGYFVYKMFFGEKFQEIETEEGWKLYLDATNKSGAKEEYYVYYTKKDSNGKINGSATVDNFGFYHKWDGDYSGNEYVVDIGGGRYGYFAEENGTKSSATMTASAYNSSYGEIEEFSGLEFVGSTVMVDSETAIRALYGSFTVVKDEFKHVFGELSGKTVWRTTYTCEYEYNGVKYAGEYVRDVYFDATIDKVTVKIADKEVGSNGKTVRNGKSRKVEIEYNIEYKTNQSLLKTDFSEYPAIA